MSKRASSDGGDLPDTFYAPAARASEAALHTAIALASHNPVIDTVMQVFGGLVAVLNENRQILSVNYALLDLLGIRDAGKVLGLRPGEAVRCVRAKAHPGGCGTSKYCSNCGAVIAIVTALETGKPEERECVLTVNRDGKTTDIDFAVRCCPIKMDRQTLLLLFLQDISEEKRRGALERTFFHDISNLLTSLSMASDMLVSLRPQSDLVDNVRQSVALLVKEMELQRALCRAHPEECPFSPQETTVDQILDRVQGIYATHPEAVGKVLRLTRPTADLRLTTDSGLVLRVLMNMITNALEASRPAEEVRVWVEPGVNDVTFLVWNRQVVPEGVALRIFQRYYTTKPGSGRGLGTFAMKWIAERYLKGEVAFTSTEADGTTFRLRIPHRL